MKFCTKITGEFFLSFSLLLFSIIIIITLQMFQSCLLLVLLVISTLAAPLDEGGEGKGAVVGEGAGGREGGGEVENGPVVGEGGEGVATESPSPLTVAEKGAVKAAESEVEVEYDEDYEYEEELDEGIIIGTQTSRVSVHQL